MKWDHLYDHILYQNFKKDLPPILLEREPGKFYLNGQNLYLAASLFEYRGTTNYESITGASVQALIFKPIHNEKIEEAMALLKKAFEW